MYILAKKMTISFVKKKQYFLYWIAHIAVEYIEQVTDKSLINSPNSFMDLLYFLHMRFIFCKHFNNYISKSYQETFNFLSGLTSQYR